MREVWLCPVCLGAFCGTLQSSEDEDVSHEEDTQDGIAGMANEGAKVLGPVGPLPTSIPTRLPPFPPRDPRISPASCQKSVIPFRSTLRDSPSRP